MTEHEENILLGFQNTAQSIGSLQIILFGKHCNIKKEREKIKSSTHIFKALIHVSEYKTKSIQNN